MIKESKNIELIGEVANGFGDLIDTVAFIGGSVAQLYADDPASSDIRPTLDVDCVVSLSTRSTYYELEQSLRNHGFRNDTTPGAPICRWVFNGILVDIMPTDAEILGFGNEWYVIGFQNRVTKRFPNGTNIYIFPVEYYLATKLAALESRGGRDLRLSHDFEDIVYLLDNCSTLMDEISDSSDVDLKAFFHTVFRRLLNNPNLREAIQCALPIQSEDERIYYILELITGLSELP